MAIADVTGPVISPSRLCHVVLRTTPAKYKIMVDWYLKFLGGYVVWGNDSLSFISYDDEHHRIGISGFENAVPRAASASKSCGLAHVAFAFDSLEDLLTSYVVRKKAGIYPSWCVNHGPTTSIYYADPDGNEVETQVDNFTSNDEATAFMCGPEFTENPFGVDFDPEHLIERLESGEPEDSLKKRPNIGPRSKR
ncbi:Glyoxalase/Bleomycin resistance protein/Dihydroxybiphenyl dioxygenase [Paraphoma chrysanthemicola]|uniref:Glyoxalase/Bleomycin resistance protein/Dihydroxybiphenyl dioxygenase n=1 Tax=Paraphoma chrysanthemicola TaxID=798071 RepID=A0A8K0VYW6_9PLEO|nr:Glyoxalase/Bleomycin resistance protein/Dihydroxybiphenyl dioxygenase [Paraphoma chrysanthemicola]